MTTAIFDFELVSGRIGDFFATRDDLITRQIQQYGAHSRPELAMVLSCLHTGDVVLDIGAHIGSYTVPMARFAGPSGTVFAFEPQPASHQLLRWNVVLNGVAGTVMTLPLAIGSDASRYQPTQEDAENSGATHLVSSPDGTVESISLDTWVSLHSLDTRPDLIKIDVEGMEFEVLKGGNTTLERDRPIISLEIAPEQLARYGAEPGDVLGLLNALDYLFVVNEGRRNAATDHYEPAILDRPPDYHDLIDVLAIPRMSERLEGVFERAKSRRKRPRGGFWRPSAAYGDTRVINN